MACKVYVWITLSFLKIIQLGFGLALPARRMLSTLWRTCNHQRLTRHRRVAQPREKPYNSNACRVAGWVAQTTHILMVPLCRLPTGVASYHLQRR